MPTAGHRIHADNNISCSNDIKILQVLLNSVV